MSFLRDFNGLAKKPIRQEGNAEPKKMRRCPAVEVATSQLPKMNLLNGGFSINLRYMRDRRVQE